jgi:diamine N-acetyltransferase
MKALKVTARPVTAENWRAAIALEIHPEQRDFTPPVAVSLAKAYIQPDGAAYDPYAVYRGKTMVGFYSFSYYPGNMRWCALAGFLIDKAYQGRGYGRAALLDFLTWVPRKHPECTDIFLTVHPRNIVAQRLYHSLGFIKTGDLMEAEEVMRFVLPTPKSFSNK